VLLNEHGHLKVRNILTEPDTKTYALPNYFCNCRLTQRPRS
jgi:hypothetical protein